MSRKSSPDGSRIQTQLTDLVLFWLAPEHALDYYLLVERNRNHLTRHGDYEELRRATFGSIATALSDPDDPNEKYGIQLNGTLVGRVDLSPRAAGHFVLGYWIGREFTGNGFATLACKALIEHVRDHLGATAIYAGVTKGNHASERVLARLGFRHLEDRDSYTLFHLPLPAWPDVSS